MWATNPSALYAIILGGILLLFFLGARIRWSSSLMPILISTPVQWATLFALKHLFYPRTFMGKPRIWFLLQLIYWPGTIVSTFIQTHTLTDIRIRSGYIAMINLLPLLMSDRLRFLADIFGVSIRTFTGFHGTLGTMSTLQGILHMAVAIHQAGWHLKQNLQFYGLLAISGIVLCLATHFLRGVANEILSKIHGMAAILIGIVSLFHLIKCNKYSLLKILIPSIGIALLILLRWTVLLIRNIKYPRIASRAAIIPMKQPYVVRIVIPVNRPFRVQAGMRIYVWMPGVGIRYAFRSYSFPISWWENDTKGNATSITILAQKQTEFNRRLADHPNSQYLTWLDGPYGRPDAIESYSRVLLIATGAGIIPLLSFIRSSVESNLNRQGHCEIFIVWEVEHKSNFDWIYDWMDELLRKDKGGYNLRFAIHTPSADGNKRAHETWKGNHGRIFRIYSPISAEDAIPNEFFKDKRKALIAVSARKEIVKELYDIVSRQMIGIVNIVRLES